MMMPVGGRIEFKAPKRTVPQNDRMWAMLTDVAGQKVHCERKYSPDQWKVIFLAACGREMQFIPSLDGSTFIPWGQSSSDLSKDEMSALIEFMQAWGAENGVIFHDTPPIVTDADTVPDGLGAPPVRETATSPTHAAPVTATRATEAPSGQAAPKTADECRTPDEYVAYARDWIANAGLDRPYAQGMFDDEFSDRERLGVGFLDRANLQRYLDEHFTKAKKDAR